MAYHSLVVCITTGTAISKEQQTPGEPCPHCGVILRKKGGMTAFDDPIPTAGVLISTTESLPGYQLKEVIGLVTGHVGHVLSTERSAHQQAIKALTNAARQVGGNCVLGLRLSATDRTVIAYGTAATVEPLRESTDSSSSIGRD